MNLPPPLTNAELDAAYRGFFFNFEVPFIPKSQGGGIEFDTTLSVGYLKGDRNIRLMVLVLGFGFRFGYYFGAPERIREFYTGVEGALQKLFNERREAMFDPTETASAQPPITKH